MRLYGHWLRPGRRVGVRAPVEAIFFPPRVVQTGYGAHPASGVTPPGREADHSPPTTAEDKNTWIYTSTPPYIFMT
jgi:hypothetical protein